MKQAINASLTASLALLATSAFAADEISRPNYNYIEADLVYGEAEVDFGDDSVNLYFTDGYAIRGSVVAEEQFLLRGSYYSGSGDYKSGRDIDWDSWLIGAGWLIPTEDSTGIDMSLDYRTDDFDVSDNIDGFGISVGVRAAPIQNLELGVRLGWYEGDYDGAVGFTLNAAYNFTEHWGVNLFWDEMNDTSVTLDQYGLGGRYYF